MGKLLRHIAITTILFLTGCSTLWAQNNAYEMDDSLYADYQKAYKLRKSKEGCAMAEDIIRRARKIGDKNGEIVAMTIPLLYEYYKPNNLQSVEHQADLLTTKAKEYGAWSVYYFAVSNKVNYMVKMRQFIHALLYAQEQEKFAQEHGHVSGIRDTHYMIATVQQFREEYVDAINSYQAYIDYAKAHTKRTNVTDGHINICDCYRKTNQYERMLAEALCAEADCRTAYDHYDVTVQRCYANFMTGHYEDFRNDYQWLKQHQKDNRGLRDIVQRAIKVMEVIDKEHYAEAERMIKDIKAISEFESLRLGIALALKQGDYTAATKKRWQLIDVIIYSGNGFVSDEHMTIADKIKNEEQYKQQLETQNDISRLALASTQLQLKNSSLELSRANDTARLANIIAERHWLDFQRQELDNKQLQDSVDSQQELQRIKAEKDRNIQRGEFLILIMVSVIIIATLIYVDNQRRQGKNLQHGIRRLRDSIHRLNTSRQIAQESELMKSRFVQNMSHEIRTPLNAIVGFSNVLTTMSNELDDKERTQLTKYIIDNSSLLTTLVNDILDLTNLQSSNYVMELGEVNVNDLCRETIETVRHRAQAGVKLHFDTTLNDRFTAYTDQRRVQQVLINMLTNAEKNTAQGSITLQCRRTQDDNDKITFTVTDTGCGVPKDKMDEIFERFHKLDNTKQGSGLGLDICRTIAAKLGGSIDIDRQYTTGARFIFIIPFRP